MRILVILADIIDNMIYHPSRYKQLLVCSVFQHLCSKWLNILFLLLVDQLVYDVKACVAAFHDCHIPVTHVREGNYAFQMLKHS